MLKLQKDWEVVSEINRAFLEQGGVAPFMAIMREEADKLLRNVLGKIYLKLCLR
jgi:hypothetical protein